MNILQAKNEIKNTVKAYLSKNQFGEYEMMSSYTLISIPDY